METKFSVKDSIRAELRKSGNASEVRKSCRSMSLFNEVLNEHIDERAEELEELDCEKSKLEFSVVRLREEKTELEDNKRLLSAGNQKLVLDNNRLREEVEQKGSKVEDFNQKLEYLSAKGISLEMLEKVSGLVERSGDMLLDQLVSLKDRNNIAKDCDVLKKRKSSLERMLKMLEKKCDRVDAQRIAKEDQLETIKDVIVEAKAKFDIIENKVIDSIHTTEYSAIAAINNMTEYVSLHGNAVSADIIKNLEAVAHETSESIDRIGVLAEDKILQKIEITEDTLKHVENRILNLAESFKNGLGEFAYLQQQIGVLKNDVLYGNILFGIRNSTDYLSRIPPSFVVDILYQLGVWAKINFPDKKICPSRDITEKDFQLNQFYHYKVDVVLDFLAEGISKFESEKALGDEVKNART